MKKGDTLTVVDVEYKNGMTICVVQDEKGNRYVGVDPVEPEKAISEALTEK